MTDGLADLAERWRRRMHRQRSVLVLGFDATAALLGHPDHLQLSEWLGGNSYVADIESEICKRVAADAEADDRRMFLRGITTPANGRSPDRAAIGVIASLLEADFLQAVVATDPDLLLYMELRACGLSPLPLVIAEGYAEDQIRPFLNPARNGRLFLDAGGTLIRGYRKGIDAADARQAQRTAGHVIDVQRRLKEFFGQYEQLYCWGWSEANVQLQWIYQDGSQPSIHAIGRYTECGEPDTNSLIPYELNDKLPSDPEWGAGWLPRLADLLKLPPTSISGPATSTSGPAPMTVSRSSRAPRISPLLPADVLDGFKVEEPERAVTIVGIANRSVRQAAANWLFQEISGEGRAAVLREDQVFAELDRQVSIQVQRSIPLHIVGCFMGDVQQDDPVWQIRLATVVRAWLEPLPRVSDTGHRITLFCPSEMSAWVHAQWDESPEPVWAETYRTIDTSVGAVQNWVHAALRRLSCSIESEQLADLARLIVSTDPPDRALSAVLLPEALEFWLLDITDRLAARSEPNEISPTDLVIAWNAIVDRYLAVSEEFGMTSDLEAVLRDSDDFELGPIREHVPDQESLLDGDEPGTGQDDPAVRVRTPGDEESNAGQDDGQETGHES